MTLKLLKINLRAMLSSMFNRGSGARKNNSIIGGNKIRPAGGTALGKIGLAVLFLYCIGAFGFMFIGLFSSFRDPFVEAGIGWLYFAFAGIITLGLCTITTIFTAQAQIFNAKDNEMLLALPIRPSAILLSRILTLLLFEYIFELLVMIPALIVWLAGGYGTPLGILFFAIGFVLLPLLALALSCLLAWILTIVTARMRRKNILMLVISVAFLIAYFALFGNLQKYMTTLLERGEDIAAAFRRGFPPIYFFGNALASGNVLDAVLFILCCIIPFAIIIALLSANFVRVATSKRGAKRIEYREGRLKTLSSLSALNRKELVHFWSNPMLVLNMSMGSLMMVIAGVAAIVKRDVLTEILAQFSAILPGLSVGMIAGLAFAFIASTNCASASLISLEGRTLWIVRSLPVRTRDVLVAKLMMHMQIGAIPSIIASVCACFALSITAPLDIFIAIFLPVLFTALMATAGLALNILIPKFNWINEVQPVKQGLPVVIIMFGAMAALFVLALPYVLLLKSVISLAVYIWIVIALLMVLTILLYRWIVTRGARRFAAYEI